MITKSTGLLLPPDFIHSEGFHKSIINLASTLKLYHKYKSDESKLWHTAIVKVLKQRASREFRYASSLRKIDYIKDFCIDVKGLYDCAIGGINQILSLEEVYDLPHNLIDDTYIKDLLSKYNYYNNYVVEFKFNNYVLLDIHGKYIGDEFY